MTTKKETHVPKLNKKKRTIKPQHKKFVRTVIATGKQGLSYKMTVSPLASDKTAQEQASKLMAREDIQEYFLEILDKADLTDNKLASKLNTIIDNALNNVEKTTPADGLRGIELAYRLRARLGNGTGEKQGPRMPQNGFNSIGMTTDTFPNSDKRGTNTFIPVHTQNIYILKNRSDDDLMEMLKQSQRQTQELINTINKDRGQQVQPTPPPPEN